MATALTYDFFGCRVVENSKSD